jgi:hypothetical protein
MEDRMRDLNRSIFRADALRRYVESRDELVAPPSVSPRTLVGLWLLLGLLAGAGAVTWLAAGAAVARVEQCPAPPAVLALAGRSFHGEIVVWTERLLSLPPLLGRPVGA